MHEITLENYRCFREPQKARLAPLTFLVGENSAGKTSFMALIQVLLDIVHSGTTPNFKKSPYDLGSFDEIAHYRDGRDGRADTFRAGFSTSNVIYRNRRQAYTKEVFHIEFEFGRGSGTAPVLIEFRLSNSNTHFKVQRIGKDKPSTIRFCFETSNGSWQIKSNSEHSPFRPYRDNLTLVSELSFIVRHLQVYMHDELTQIEVEAIEGAEKPTSDDLAQLVRLHDSFERWIYGTKKAVVAGAPVRSKPNRTYDPSHHAPDPQGDYIPTFLANMFFENKNYWERLKLSLEEFGQESGLFDEISIKPLRKRGSEPFQLQVRKFGNRTKGPSRNLIDVGYGVSQVLPIITELSNNKSFSTYLIQQPEIHLHPSVQAALGSFFCATARPGKLLVVETHSDYLLDRVRTDIRDGKSNLKPDDVSILFFERKNIGVHIHSLEIDRQGNILGAPNVKSHRKVDTDCQIIWLRK